MMIMMIMMIMMRYDDGYRRVLCTHAYMLSEDAARKLLTWTEKPNDTLDQVCIVGHYLRYYFDDTYACMHMHIYVPLRVCMFSNVTCAAKTP